DRERRFRFFGEQVMHGPLEHARVYSRDQRLGLFSQVLLEIDVELFCAANKGAIVFAAQKVVENALPSHPGGSSDDGQVFIQQIDVPAGFEIGNVENLPRKQLVKVPGTPGKDPVGFALNPDFKVGFFDLHERGFVDAQVQGLVAEGKPKLPNDPLGRLVHAGILLQDLGARNCGFADAGHNLRADRGIRDFETQLVDYGRQANWGLPVPVVSHKIAPWEKITSQITRYDRNSSLILRPILSCDQRNSFQYR